MGSGAMYSFMRKCSPNTARELVEEALNHLPERIKALEPRIKLEPEVDELERWLVVENAEGAEEYLALAPLTIFDLEERLGEPDTEIAW